ncbi:hypothetical protein J6590_021606 [Homalodisca vitripennis]|nr:hypothetical protein J6590_021606 [Homalodisca vitripennis]
MGIKPSSRHRVSVIGSPDAAEQSVTEYDIVPVSKAQSQSASAAGLRAVARDMLHSFMLHHVCPIAANNIDHFMLQILFFPDLTGVGELRSWTPFTSGHCVRPPVIVAGRAYVPVGVYWLVLWHRSSTPRHTSAYSSITFCSRIPDCSLERISSTYRFLVEGPRLQTAVSGLSGRPISPSINQTWPSGCFNTYLMQSHSYFTQFLDDLRIPMPMPRDVRGCQLSGFTCNTSYRRRRRAD